MKKLKLVVGSAAFACVSGLASAAVNFSQNGNEITMEVVNETYTLSVDQSQDILYVAFLDVFLPGGDAVDDSSRISGSATMSVNGGAATPLNWWTGWQYRPGFQDPWTPEDVAFLFSLAPGTLHAGDVITINGTLTMDASTNPNIILPQVEGTVSTAIGGHDFYYSAITSSSLNAGGPTIAAPTSIPTLSEWGMITLSGLLALGSIFTLRRRRQ